MKAAELRRWERYFTARNEGHSPEQSARKARLSPATAYRFEREDPTSGGLEAASILGIQSVAGNLVGQPLNPEAAEALKDFNLFRRRYMGRESEPWQTRAAYEMLRFVESGQKDYVVVNAPPGSGKSTLFTHDIPVWLIVRNRAIRMMLGSRTERQARMYVGRIKKTLERATPLLASSDDIALGIGFDAVATVADDFGAFKPEARSDLWAANALTVRQMGGQATDDKESTASAWGRDSGFLGGRYDVVIWDDLVDRKNTKTAEALDDLIEWWRTEAETRLEPGGTLILQGQRITHDDLYRFALDETNLDDTPKYRHIRYQAHDEERCQGDHDNDPKPWPDGCLLSPYRLPWSQLAQVKKNSPRTYDVMYQQLDGDTAGGLVEPEWISGGIDSHGYPAPGCLDPDRPTNIRPVETAGNPIWSFVTVDPSPTEWWGIIWWAYDSSTGRRYAIDLQRRKLNPEDFLTLDYDTNVFDGVLEQMREHSNKIAIPITTVIFEANAAQRWFLSQPHVNRWATAHAINVVPHQTNRNKNDTNFGLESIGDLFRQGLIRLPNSTPGARIKSGTLIDEALKYPDSKTTDMLMSTWFMHLGVLNHYTPERQGRYETTGINRNVKRGLVSAGR